MLKIEFRPGGDVSRSVAEREAARLSLDGSIETEVIRYRQLFGIDVLAVTIVGGAVGNLLSHLIVRLGEAAIARCIPITISFKKRGTVRTFKLPEQQAICLDTVSKGDDQDGGAEEQ